MKTCNDCIHCEACISQVPRTFWDSETFYEGCKYFKDKSRFVELPCKVGDTVYQIDAERVFTSTVKAIVYDTDNIAFDERSISKKIFLTREEAEKALSERNTT